MAAGFTYNLTPEEVKEERYDVETGRRRRGPYKLDTANLPVGEYLPSFTPIAADLVKKTAKVAIRVEVAEKYESGTSLKVKKGSLVYATMNLGDGANGATVNVVNKQNADYDELTLADAFGSSLEAGTILYEATDVNGTTPKVVANSALYERKLIENGIVLVALLMRAYEIEPLKLVMPFHDVDKANMPHFQFNAPDIKGVSKENVYTEATQSASGLMSSTDKKKLDGIAANANKYTLPNASSSAIGGVKQGVAVADAAGGDEKDKLNALLASLRNAGVIANS